MELNSRTSLGEWIRWLFGSHPESFDEDDVYLLGDVDIAAALKLLTDLFQNSEVLLHQYSSDQILNGFNHLMSHCWLPDGSPMVSGLVWDEDLPWHDRKHYIHSMGDLFEHLFARMEVFPSLAYMWWDSMAEACADCTEARAFLEILCRILNLKNRACIESALHGLGHLYRGIPKMVADTINEFLENHPSLDRELREYALVCASGKAQ